MKTASGAVFAEIFTIVKQQCNLASP